MSRGYGALQPPPGMFTFQGVVTYTDAIGNTTRASAVFHVAESTLIAAHNGKTLEFTEGCP